MARLAGSCSAVLLVICGAVNALLSKIVYQLEAPDCSGAVKKFEKPWLQTALMFVAMALCLPIAWLQEAWNAKKKKNTSQACGDSAPDAAGSSSHGSRKRQEEQHQQPYSTEVTSEAPASPKTTEAAAAALTKAAALSALISIAATAPPTAAASAAAPHTQASDDASLRQPLLGNNSSSSSSGGGGGSRGGQSRPRQPAGKVSAMKEALLLCIPTGFDLTATTLMNVGLLYVAASVFQILRGAEMVFAALFAVTFLRRPLNRWHYMGVALCLAGITCVGASRLLAGDSSGEAAADSLRQGTAWPLSLAGWLDSAKLQQGAGDAKMAAIGMVLILLSQAIQAGQVTVEDYLMSDLDIQPLKVVGYEGLIGSLVMMAGALPLLQRLPFQDGSGMAEDTVGSWCMVKNSPAIAGALGVSTLAVLLYNICGMYVTEDVGAAARTVLENARTLLVWLAALALYYTHIGGGKLGEAWGQWSWLQAIGFAIFAAGAFLYDKGHQKHEEDAQAAGKAPEYSRWAVLKSTLSMHTGHFVGRRRFRAAGMAVMAGIRARNMANGRADEGDESV